MALKWKSNYVSTSLTATIEVLCEEVKRSNARTAYIMHIPSTYIESHLGKKQPQPKIPIAFLFSQLHFNNVFSDALFHGGQLVTRSKIALQNQRITLNTDCII